MENKPNKTSKSAPQEKSKREPSYYEKKIDQIARLLENQKISQIIIHGGSKKLGEVLKEAEVKIEEGKIVERKETMEEKEVWSLDPDLDAESASILLNLFNKKPLEEMYAEGAHTAIVPKGGSDENLEIKKEGLIVYIDNGGRWIEVVKNGKETKIYFDHHGKGRGPDTSATKMIYHLLKKQNPKLEEENPWLFKYVKGVNDLDNLNYINRDYFNKEHFEKVWPYTLNNIGRQMKAMDLMNLFNSGTLDDFSKSAKKKLNEKVTLEKIEYSDRDKEGNKKGTENTVSYEIKFGDIILKNGKTINEQIEEDVKEGGNIDKTISGIYATNKFKSDLLGKVVFQEHKRIIPDHLAFIWTKASGYDSYAAWNEKKHKFFINSNEEGLGEIIKKLNEADPDCALDVRGVMVFGTIKNLTKEQFKKILGLNEKIEKVKTNKNENENELKIQENNKKIEILKQEVAEIDEEIAKLKALILKLPDEKPEFDLTPDPQIVAEIKKADIERRRQEVEKLIKQNSERSEPYGKGIKLLGKSGIGSAPVYVFKKSDDENFATYEVEINKIVGYTPDIAVGKRFGKEYYKGYKEYVSYYFFPKDKVDFNNIPYGVGIEALMVIRSSKENFIKHLNNKDFNDKEAGDIYDFIKAEYDKELSELGKTQVEKVIVDENKENKITSEDFKELVRLSKFFLENPKEPTTVGSIENKYPELFEEITEVEKKRKEAIKNIESVINKEGDLEGNITQYAGYESFNKDENFFSTGMNEQLIIDKINSKYDTELSELGKTQVEKVIVDENKEKEVRLKMLKEELENPEVDIETYFKANSRITESGRKGVIERKDNEKIGKKNARGVFKYIMGKITARELLTDSSNNTDYLFPENKFGFGFNKTLKDEWLEESAKREVVNYLPLFNKIKEKYSDVFNELEQ